MVVKKNIRDVMTESYGDELLFLDEKTYDRAIVGVVERFGAEQSVCYDRKIVIEVLQEAGMSRDEAYEYYEYNILGGWAGEYTPTFLINDDE